MRLARLSGWQWERYLLRLKTPYSDGTSHLLFSGLEFVEKLAALVPPPKIHLTRFFGCLAPNAKIRSMIVPKKTVPEPTASLDPKPAPVEISAKPKSRRIAWACAFTQILTHLGLPSKPPPIAPLKLYEQMSFS